EWRHHADHRVSLVVQGQGLSNGTGIGAKTAPPESVAQDGNAIMTGAVFSRQNGATPSRADFKNLEEVRPGEQNAQRLGSAAPRRIDAFVGVEGDAREDPILLLPGHEFVT